MKRLACGCYFHKDELYPLDWSQRHFIRGNINAFGLRHGLWVSVTLMSPLLNTLVYWRYRSYGLTFRNPETGQEVSPLEAHAIVRRLSERERERHD